MKKYLIVFLMLFVGLFVACGDDPVEGEHPVTEADPIIAEHQYNVAQDEVSPYVLVESILNESKDLIYSLTYISIFPKTYLENDQEVTVTGRYYDYYQVDYVTDSGKYYNYFHEYDYLDSTERSYGQNFMPHFNFNEQLKELSVLVKYRFDRNNESYSEEVKFKESIIQFNIDNFNNNELENYSVDVNKIKNPNEDFNRYKLTINFDDEIKTGHFDIQTWVEIDNNIYPFIGYYHYRPNHGDIYTASDIKVPAIHQITKIYYTIVYYNESNQVTNTYYVYNLN